MSDFSHLNKLIFLGCNSLLFLIDCFIDTVYCQVHWPCLDIGGWGGRGWVSIQLSLTVDPHSTVEFIT